VKEIAASIESEVNRNTLYLICFVEVIQFYMWRCTHNRQAPCAFERDMVGASWDL